MSADTEKKTQTKEKPILVQELILTKDIFMRYARINYNIYRMKSRYICLGIAVLLIIICCVIFFDFSKYFVIAIVLSVFAAYLLFMFFWGYLYAGTSSYKNLVEFYGDPVKMTILFYKNYFCIQTDKGGNEFLYTQISDRIERKGISILIVRSKGIIQHGQVINRTLFDEKENQQYDELLASYEMRFR